MGERHDLSNSNELCHFFSAGCGTVALIMLSAVIVTMAATPALADPAVLSLGARSPQAIVTSSSGLGTTQARAAGRVTTESAQKHCRNHYTDEPKITECVATWLKEFPDELAASADCNAGVLQPTSGASYTYAGEWGYQEALSEHRSKWRGPDGSIVGLSTAAGGGELAQQWTTLCGAATPERRITAQPKDAPSSQESDESAHLGEGGQIVMFADHNGSGVQIGETKIVYDLPKPSIRDVVRQGTVLVEGRWSGDRFSGVAYAFKKGCPPAKYAVSGRRQGMDEFVLSGAGPVRRGCQVVGYSTASPHANLRFSHLISP